MTTEVKKRALSFQQPKPLDWTPTKGEQVWVKPGYRVLKAEVVTVAGRFLSLKTPGCSQTLSLELDDVRPVCEKHSTTGCFKC